MGQTDLSFFDRISFLVAGLVLPVFALELPHSAHAQTQSAQSKETSVHQGFLGGRFRTLFEESAGVRGLRGIRGVMEYRQ